MGERAIVARAADLAVYLCVRTQPLIKGLDANPKQSIAPSRRATYSRYDGVPHASTRENVDKNRRKTVARSLPTNFGEFVSTKGVRGWQLMPAATAHCGPGGLVLLQCARAVRQLMSACWFLTWLNPWELSSFGGKTSRHYEELKLDGRDEPSLQRPFSKP